MAAAGIGMRSRLRLLPLLRLTRLLGLLTLLSLLSLPGLLLSGFCGCVLSPGW